MSDDPPDHPKRWRGARRPPSRLATATTLVLVPLGGLSSACGTRESTPDGGPSRFEAPSPTTAPSVPGLAFDRMDPSRPWFDTLPSIGDHPAHHEGDDGARAPTGRRRPVRLPPVAPRPPTVREDPAPADPSWPDSVGRLIARRYDDPDRVTIEDYYLYLPPGFHEEDREWPVILYLHGRSLRGDDLDRVQRYGIPSLIARGRQLPFIVVAPQLPDGQHWVDVDRMWDLLEEAVLEEYPVDEDRIYVTGFSMGGGGTWRFAVRHADRLAAAVPISATTPPPSEAWTEALEDLPMLVYHGDEDQLAAYRPAVHMVEHLRASGQEIDLVTLEGEGHGIVQDVYRDPELYLWLLAHER